MAKVKNNIGLYDIFTSKCPKCGAEVTYSRRDIIIGSRYPEGCALCPSCKTPIAHHESNLTRSGQEYIDNLPRVSKEEYEACKKQAKVLLILHHIFLPVGIVTMILGPILTIIMMAKYKDLVNEMFIISGSLFVVGLALIITARIFTTMINNRLLFLETRKYE